MTAKQQEKIIKFLDLYMGKREVLYGSDIKIPQQEISNYRFIKSNCITTDEIIIFYNGLYGGGSVSFDELMRHIEYIFKKRKTPRPTASFAYYEISSLDICISNGGIPIEIIKL